MKIKLAPILERMIDIEKNIARLYNVFANAYPQDSAFWTSLAKDEVSHARLLETNQERIIQSHYFQKLLSSSTIESLNCINCNIEKNLKDVEIGKIPLRLDCFVIALQLEQSAGDSQLQHVMDEKSNDPVVQVLQILSSGDHDHAVKITEYLKSISIKK